MSKNAEIHELNHRIVHFVDHLGRGFATNPFSRDTCVDSSVLLFLLIPAQICIYLPAFPSNLGEFKSKPARITWNLPKIFPKHCDTRTNSKTVKWKLAHWFGFVSPMVFPIPKHHLYRFFRLDGVSHRAASLGVDHRPDVPPSDPQALLLMLGDDITRYPLVN